jgi:RecB family exonuclease
MKTFKHCRRKYYFQYVQRWDRDPRTTNPVSPRELGTRIHCALEAYYGYDIDPLSALGYIYDLVIDERPDYEEDLRKECQLAVVMVSGYLEWVAEEGIDEDHQVVSTESVVSVPVLLPNGNTVTVKGKLDQVVRRMSDGVLRFRDFKTVGTLGKANGLVRDEQMRLYSLLMLLDTGGGHGRIRVDGGLYNMLLRSKRTARATGPFYEQLEVSYNTDDHRSMQKRLIGTLVDMERMHNELAMGTDHQYVAYPNPDERCEWMCPFSKVCSLHDDGSRAGDAMKANFISADPMKYYDDPLITKVVTRFKVEPDD